VGDRDSGLNPSNQKPGKASGSYEVARTVKVTKNLPSLKAELEKILFRSP
jgi:hypothetical protein